MTKKLLIVILLVAGASEGSASLYCSELFGNISPAAKDDTRGPRFTLPSKRDLMVLAKKHFDNGRLEDAVNMLEMILQQDANDFRAMALYSKILYLSKDPKKIEQAYAFQKRVLELEPQFREVNYIVMAQILAKLGRPEESATYMQELLAINPDHSAAMGILARQYLNQGKLREARDIIEKKGRVAELSNVQDPHYLGLSAEVSFKLGNRKMALNRSNQLINDHTPRKNQLRVPKQFIIGLILKAKILASDLSRLDEAHQLLNKAEQHLGFFSWFELLRAEIYYKQGRVIESKSSLKRLLQKSKFKELYAIAALVKIEQNKNSDDPLLEELFKHLSVDEVQKVMVILKTMDWNINSAEMSPVETSSDIQNDFWSNLYTIPINSQARGF